MESSFKFLDIPDAVYMNYVDLYVCPVLCLMSYLPDRVSFLDSAERRFPDPALRRSSTANKGRQPTGFHDQYMRKSREIASRNTRHASDPHDSIAGDKNSTPPCRTTADHDYSRTLLPDSNRSVSQPYPAAAVAAEPASEFGADIDIIIGITAADATKRASFVVVAAHPLGLSYAVAEVAQPARCVECVDRVADAMAENGKEVVIVLGLRMLVGRGWSVGGQPAAAGGRG